MNNIRTILYDSFHPMEYTLLPQFLDDNFFQKKQTGSFVEFGAHDGIAGSCTKFFEDRGWKGICIEPHPQLFERLKKNRTAQCIHCGITTDEKTCKFLKINQPGPECLSGIINQYDPRHIQRIQYEVLVDQGSADVIDIECHTFNTIAKKYGLQHIDLLSIDTEGGELGILQSIDLKQINIDVIVAENNYKDPQLPAFLISQGYNFVFRCGPDEIFKKLTFPNCF